MQTVKVFDTRVEAPGRRLHFDVITTDEATAVTLANAYVSAQGYPSVTVTAEHCQFCHAEPLLMFSEPQQKEFRETGGFIVPLSL